MAQKSKKKDSAGRSAAEKNTEGRKARNVEKNTARMKANIDTLIAEGGTYNAHATRDKLVTIHRKTPKGMDTIVRTVAVSMGPGEQLRAFRRQQEDGSAATRAKSKGAHLNTGTLAENMKAAKTNG